MTAPGTETDIERGVSRMRSYFARCRLVVPVLAVLLSATAVSAPSALAASGFPTTASVDTFERAAENPLSDEGKWSKLGWTKTIGRVYSSTFGWVPKEGGAGAPESEADGAYWNAAAFTNPAVSVHMYSENLHDYVALWCDTTGTGSKNGYRLKAVGVGSNYAFKLVLEKWVNGEKTTFAESPEIDFAHSSHENIIGLTDVGGKVQGWYGTTEASMAIEIEASSTTFTSGHVGIEGTNDGAYGETKYRAVSDVSPVNTATPSIADETPWGAWLEGQKVSATTGTWTGTGPISYTYQWESCNSGGASCANISGATASTFMPTSGLVGDTLRVVVTATNIDSSGKATSEPSPQIKSQATPEAHVVNGAGQIVQSYGNTYAGGPGGQIQLAEAYAHAHSDSEVTLDPGTFLIRQKGGATTGKLGAYCYGIFAYGNIRLRGSYESSSIIQSIAGPHACEGFDYSANHTEEYLYPLLYVGANAENQEETMTKLHVENMILDGNNEAYAALMVGTASGSEMLVQYITTQESLLTGIWLAQATGTSSSPVLVQYNTVRNAGSDGIVANGEYINVQGNAASNVGYRNYASNAITGGQSNVKIYSNVVSNSQVGIGLEGQNIGHFVEVYNNEMRNDCLGINVSGSYDDTIYENRQYDYSGEDACQTPGCSEYGTCGAEYEVGLRLIDSYNNFAYGNSLNSNGNGWGIVLWGTGTGHATEWNYIGLTWAVYVEYPGPIIGNTINDFGNAMVIEGPPEDNGGNALWGNNGSTSGACSYDNDNQNMADNSPASCN
jgi:hypothetical protein